MDIRKAAAVLYGGEHTDLVYIDALATDLDMSKSGVRKWWYKQRNVAGPAKVALKFMLAAKKRAYAKHTAASPEKTDAHDPKADNPPQEAPQDLGGPNG